jgi:branched-chain amino acid transport system substrate-binding protein
MIKRRDLLLTTAAATVVAASPVRAQGKPPIKVAHTGPMSGIIATIGKLQSIAVDIAVADVNAKGGVNGSPIQIIRYDDELKPDEGVLRIRDAMAAGAACIIGPLSGTQWETAAPLLNQLKFPGFNVNANKPGINKRPWAFRIQVTDDLALPPALSELLEKYPHIKKVAVLGDVREASGKAAIDIWKDLAKKAGLTVTDTVTFTSGQPDFSPIAIKLKELKPDGILLSMLLPDAIRLAREMQIQNIGVPVMGNSLIFPGTLPQTLSKTIGENAKLWHTSAFATNEWSTGDQTIYKSFVERYDAEVLKDPAMAQFTPPNVANTSLGYDVVQLIAELMRRAGIDGTTPTGQAREKLMQQMVAIKEFRCIHQYKVLPSGDVDVPSHAAYIDPQRREWAFLTKKV